LKIQGAVPDAIAYTALLTAFEKAQQSKRALETFQAMKLQGVVPTFFTYSALISACEKGEFCFRRS